MILLDTNVLVYAVNDNAPQHAESRSVLEVAMAGDVPGVVVPQVLLEFFAVVTHPRRVQHPLDPERAWEQVSILQSALPVLEVRPLALSHLEQLVRHHRPTGGALYDLFLVAQMRSHGVAHICTYNATDFASVSGIQVLHPGDIRRPE